MSSANLSIRTVPDQQTAEVAEQLRRWIASTISEQVDYRLTISQERAQEPYCTPDDHPAPQK